MSDFQLNTKITDPQELLETFFREYPQYGFEERERISAAWQYICLIADNREADGGFPYILHPMRLACILAENRLDGDTVIAGFLHNILSLENTDAAAIEKYIETQFGAAVLNIVRLSKRITGLNMQSRTLHQADSFRKMLFAMVDDIRVILVKMADRLDRIRNISYIAADEQKLLTHEIIEIWAPLANRLGMSAFKIEMEDLSLKFTNPDVFQQLKQIVSLKKKEREEYLEKAQKEIYKTANRAGLEISVYSRAKHFYSIYQKMRKKNRTAEELLDLFAVRVLCKTASDCYIMVGLVHNLWKPLEGRFKDFIAMPKANGYQSVHTTVLCGGKPLEIQIRTNEMHSVAEHGIASHWLYKKGTNKDSVNIKDLSIINQLRELRKDHLNDEDFFNEIKEELLGDSIFVFTPKGEVRELPAGSTAIDFAYSIHTHIGETIVGAKADGHIIPFASPLKNTQIIEILTSPQAHPTHNQLQMVKTAKARSKIRSWLSAHDADFASEKLLQKDDKTEAGQDLSKIGLDQKIRPAKKGSASTAADDIGDKTGLGGSTETIKIRIGDTTNFLINIAKCCQPKYGDEIIGYVSRGRGIILHKSDCGNLKRIPNVAERTVHVEWQERLEDEMRKRRSKQKNKAGKTKTCLN